MEVDVERSVCGSSLRQIWKGSSLAGIGNRIAIMDGYWEDIHRSEHDNDEHEETRDYDNRDVFGGSR